MSSNVPELRAARPFVDIYTDGSYLEKNPTWHVEESPFKVKYITELLRRNALPIKSVCEAGCGVGEVLRLLQMELPPETEFTGFDIAPAAHELSKSRENAHLHFKFADITAEQNLSFDLIFGPYPEKLVIGTDGAERKGSGRTGVSGPSHIWIVL